MVVGSPPMYRSPACPFQMALARHELSPAGGAPVPNRVGEEPKSQSRPCPAVPAACHACSSVSDADRCTIDSEWPILLPGGHVLIVGSHSLPVDTQTSLPLAVAAALDQMLPPSDPLGTVCQVCSTWPVCWPSSTSPPRISGMSQLDARPT